MSRLGQNIHYYPTMFSNIYQILVDSRTPSPPPPSPPHPPESPSFFQLQCVAPPQTTQLLPATQAPTTTLITQMESFTLYNGKPCCVVAPTPRHVSPLARPFQLRRMSTPPSHQPSRTPSPVDDDEGRYQFYHITRPVVLRRTARMSTSRGLASRDRSPFNVNIPSEEEEEVVEDEVRDEELWHNAQSPQFNSS
jgi:hypothetical protein